MYAVVYGYNGMDAAILGLGTNYHNAKQIALRTYNDELCGEKVTWEQMCSSYAENEQYVLIVKLGG